MLVRMFASRGAVAVLLALAGASSAGACSSSTSNEGAASTGGTDAGKQCSTASDCDDGSTCNGDEKCSGGACVAGTQLPDGTSCAPGGVDAGSSSASYQCGKGECLLLCEVDADCDDANVCTGTETCGPEKTCQSGTPLDCTDSSPCTQDQCDPEEGCLHPLFDDDKDGHASTGLGACGTDCDDQDPTVHKDAPDPCNDNIDSNCNGEVNDAAPTWYADCDNDGFAPAAATTLVQCAKPTAAPAACSAGGWTGLAPAAGTTDCADQEALAHPYTASADNSAWSKTAIPGATTAVDFDFNCDGKEEKRYLTKGVSLVGGCGYTGPGPYYACSGTYGWTASVVPECGMSAEFSKCGASGLSGCTRVKEQRTQECR